MDLEKAKKLIPAAASLGSGTVLKALGKFLPGISSFVGGAYTAGYAADQILDFVKDKLETPAERRNKAQLQSRAEQGVARPDENAALSQMEQQQSPLNALSGLGKLGAQAAGGFAGAHAGAAQQTQENEREQQKIQLQEQAQQQQTEKDQYARMRQQNLDIERGNKEKESSEYKKRAEERAMEKHKYSMNKGAVQSAGKKRPVETYLDALREAQEIINRGP